MRVLYFAWVRERIGVPMENIETGATTVEELIADLRDRDDRYDVAFSDPEAIRASVDQQLVNLDAPISGAQEIAFFPPMTGG